MLTDLLANDTGQMFVLFGAVIIVAILGGLARGLDGNVHAGAYLVFMALAFANGEARHIGSGLAYGLAAVAVTVVFRRVTKPADLTSPVGSKRA